MDSKKQVADAIQQAVDGRHLTLGSSQTLLANLTAGSIPKTIGSQIPLMESQIPVVTHLILDSTGTMQGFEEVVVNSTNRAVDDFMKLREKTGQEIYFAVSEFSVRNGVPNLRAIRDFVHIQDFVPIALSEYMAYGRTPLNDAAFDGISQTMMFGSSAFAYGATGVQEVTVILTDGDENDSRDHSAGDVARFLSELNQKPSFIAAFIGVGTLNFQSVAKSMGFLDGNILTVEQTEVGLAKALKMYSSSVGSRSQKIQSGQKTTSGNFFQNI